MRKSEDGYVSASGMFKAAFPYATQAEERAEKEYFKSLESTSMKEVAGNIWVSESTALDLAEDYGMGTWITALLDPKPVETESDNPSKGITSPPKYVFTANDKTSFPPPRSRASTPGRGPGRPRRAGSPMKSEKAGSPRKQRVTKSAKAEDAANTKAAAASLQNALNEVNYMPGDTAEDDPTVKLELNETTQVNGDVETTTTNIKVDLPGGMAAEVPPEGQTKEIIMEAKAVVDAARKLEGESSKASKKRKAEHLDEDSDEADRQLQPAKKARLAEQELKKERVRNRALFGVAATLAIG
ncbi:MAG: hypothetical protein Q9222_000977 [Ikaeria aurantiellina]